MSETTINEYNRRASSYEKRWKEYLKHTHRLFLQHLDIGKNELVLDVSGGTGLLAQEVLNENYPFKELVVNDPSEGMLKIARNRLADSQGISFSNHHADQLPFGENRFDTILCLNAFHFYTEQQSVLKTFFKILKPGGRLYLLDWDRSGFFRIVNQLIKWSFPGEINSRSLAEIETMLEKSGFGLQFSKNWRWRYWKFLYVIAEKWNTI